MIEEVVKIHDKFSLEIKLGFVARKKQKISDFLMNIWIFIPNSLDVNQSTYSKTDFYRDIKSNIRLITPVYLLRDIANGTNTPFILLEKSFQKLASGPSRSNSSEYEFHIKMFLSILKSALREEVEHILKNDIAEDNSYLIFEYADNILKIAETYRNLRRIINVPTISKEQLDYYLFGDEFMSNLIEQHTFKLLKHIEKQATSEYKIQQEKLLFIINQEINYKKNKGYPVVEKESIDNNRELLFKMGMLKKYAENELYLNANKKKNGLLIEQVYLSIAAGISMIFATAIAFSFQQKYGNFTMPFFVALVISYMLKDRIKELGRFYFAHKLSRHYFDHKTNISINNLPIGWSKEAMDFIANEKVPKEVLKYRNRSPIIEANNRNNNEQIILYKKLVRLKRRNLDKSIQYSTTGMNEIIRLNFSYFTLKMDNPNVPLFSLDENNSIIEIGGEKIYSMNLILQMKNEEQIEFRRYRVLLNRDGIRGIERF